MSMLFLGMHTNSLLVQPEFRDGVPNPKYLEGSVRVIYEILHDINPCGQAAQLSAWDVWNPGRIVFFDVLLSALSALLGCMLFRRKDID